MKKLKDSIEQSRGLIEQQAKSTGLLAREETASLGLAIALGGVRSAQCLYSRRASAAGKERQDLEDGVVLRRFEARADRYRRVVQILEERGSTSLGGAARSSADREWKTSTYEVLPSGRRATKRVEKVRAASDKDNPGAVLDEFESAEMGKDLPTLVDVDMTCSCGRPFVVVVEGALLGCPVCRTVERLQARISLTGARPSSRSSRAIRSPGASADMVSSQSECRVRELIMSMQGRGTQAEDGAVEQTADWMVRYGKHPLVPFREEVKRLAQARGEDNLWKDWDEAEKELSLEASLALRSVRGPVVREYRALMKRSGAKVKTYDDCQAIATALSGLSPPRVSPSLMEYVCQLLRHAYPVYEAASKNGDNFWGGYPYWARCIFLLLGRDEYLDYINIPSMKNKEEIRQFLWKTLGWEFVPADPKATEVPSIVYTDKGATKSKKRTALGKRRRKEKVVLSVVNIVNRMRSGQRAKVTKKV